MRRILIVLSEWGFWGEELIGPLDVFDACGYTCTFCTPTGQRPRALPPSMDPAYADPPLGKAVTDPATASKVREIDNAGNPRLDGPLSLQAWFPEKPYWSDPDVLRAWETYYAKRTVAQDDADEQYDALLLVGGSGPMVDMVNNWRVHDLILGFVGRNKPVAAECYGVACPAQARNYDDSRSIIWGKHVTGHPKEYDYKNGTGVLEPGTRRVLTSQSGNFVNFGTPFYTLEYMLRDAVGPGGQFHGNVGRATSVIVDYPFITGRSTPDSKLTGEILVQVLDQGLARYGW